MFFFLTNLADLFSIGTCSCRIIPVWPTRRGLTVSSRFLVLVGLYPWPCSKFITAAVDANKCPRGSRGEISVLEIPFGPLSLNVIEDILARQRRKDTRPHGPHEIIHRSVTTKPGYIFLPVELLGHILRIDIWKKDL